ncbi:hypothetical protein GF402_06630 [Candidatus Fermentibacteria bacterium]|nr:hypothetical protein [Candidatus Fermentibacteria bacterium]
MILAMGAAILLPGPSYAPFSGDNGLKLWQASGTRTEAEGLARSMPAGIPPSQFPPALTVSEGDELYAGFSASFAWLLGHLGLRRPLPMRVWLLVLTVCSIPLLGRLSGRGNLSGPFAFLLCGLAPYSLVFWEHGPALSLFLLSALLLMEGLRRRRAVPWWLAPLLLAARWRPELLVAFAALAVTALIRSRAMEGFRSTLTQSAIVAALGMAALLLQPGLLLGEHVMQNLPGSSGSFFSTRADVYSSWFVDPSNLVATFGLLLWIAGTVIATLKPRGSLHRVSLLLAGLGTISLLYYFVRGSLGPRSLLSLSPGLLVAPWLLSTTGDRQRTLLAAGVFSMLAILVFSPTDGMFQFGPRFLLGPMALVSAGLVGSVSRTGGGRSRALLGATLIVSLVGSIRGIVFQEYFRHRHSDLAATIEHLPKEDVVCTDEPWLPLVSWWVAMERPLLVMSSPTQAESLSGEGMRVVWISSKTVMEGQTGNPGYRGLRFSGDGVRSPPPGPSVPNPPRISL